LIGVGIFRGQFYTCENAPKLKINSNKVSTKFDCLNFGGNWLNNKRNFDNIIIAILTLFEMMSSEDWLNVAYKGIDSTGIDMLPKQNSR